MANKNLTNKKLSYISLFSSAGVGCYGFKQEDFECIATNELLEKRLRVQRNNKICSNESGYILGDITDKKIQGELRTVIERNGKQVDLIVATPLAWTPKFAYQPCMISHTNIQAYEEAPNRQGREGADYQSHQERRHLGR